MTDNFNLFKHEFIFSKNVSINDETVDDSSKKFTIMDYGTPFIHNSEHKEYL